MKNFKKSLVITLAVIGGLILASLAGRLIGGEATKMATGYDNQETISAKQVFIENCNTDGGIEDYCGCVWEELIAEFTVSQISAMGNSYLQSGEYPIPLVDAVNVCVEKGATNYEPSLL